MEIQVRVFYVVDDPASFGAEEHLEDSVGAIVDGKPELVLSHRRRDKGVDFLRVSDPVGKCGRTRKVLPSINRGRISTMSPGSKSSNLFVIRSCREPRDSRGNLSGDRENRGRS